MRQPGGPPGDAEPTLGGPQRTPAAPPEKSGESRVVEHRQDQASRRDVLAAVGVSVTIALTGSAYGAEPASQAWDLRDLYADQSRWDAAATDLALMVADMEREGGRALDGAASLRDALRIISRVRQDLSRLCTYSRLQAYADLRDPKAQERRKRSDALLQRLNAATAWLEPAVLRLGQEKVDAWIGSDRDLATYRQPLQEILRSAAHALPPDEAAAILSGGGVFDGPQSIYNQVLASGMPHPTVRMSTGSLVRLDDAGYTLARALPDRSDRSLAFDAFWASYGAFKSTFGETLAAQAAGDNLQARLKHFDTALDAALFPSNAPPALFSTMISEIRAGIPLLQRYLRLKQKALGLPDLRYYDIYAPIGTAGRSFPLAEARRLMIESVKPIGEAYAKEISRNSQAHWVDPLPRPGKYAGALTNADAYDVHPYILLNYNEDYQSLSAYVHEWGHAMHGSLANAAQPFETARPTAFVAEIASTCNEQLLAEHMITTARGAQEKLFHIGQLLELLRVNIFREAMLSEFEHKIHEMAAAGTPVSGATMSGTYHRLLQDYHAPAMSIDERYAVEWSFIPQFYTAYYSFQYATSIAASSYFAQGLLRNDRLVRERYLAMLAAGSSTHEYDLVRSAGVDLADPQTYRALLRRFEGLLSQFEAAMGPA